MSIAEERTQLDEWVAKFETRAEMAEAYADLLVNLAIMDRWTMGGLKWIKTRAWKIAEGRA